MQVPIFEILTWQSATGVTDNKMINTMNQFSKVVAKLPGFLYQSLYKNSEGQWICIYFWETEQEAHASNGIVAETKAFDDLMSIIQKDSVTIEVLSSLQDSGIVEFKPLKTN